MPPKKASKKEVAAPTRRSARIQSREPSLETESVPQPAPPVAVAPPMPKPPPLSALKLQSPEPQVALKRPRSGTKMHRELTLKRIHEEYLEELAKNQAKGSVSNMPPPYPSPSKQPPLPGSLLVTPRKQIDSAKDATSPKTATPENQNEKEQPQSGWRKMLSSFGDYFASPFARKRPVDEEDDIPQPSQKRSRTEATQTELDDADEEQPQLQIEAPPTTETSAKLQSESVVRKVNRKRHVEDETPQSSNKRGRFEVPEDPEPADPESESGEEGIESSTSLDMEETPKAKDRHSQSTTPKSAHQESPRDYAGPSSRNPKLATSLSTISEYTEPSLFSNLSQIEESSPTPSKPPRTEPPRRLLNVPQSTPSQMRHNTPRSMRLTTPTIRRAALLRAAREADADIGTPNTAFFSTLRKPATKPKETNADARQAKLERMRVLQKELEELQQDDDIRAMQAHKRKRVKIDNLVSIPHNLPGDPSGMFRVPEGDSDDEMEVYDDVEERANVFEESEKLREPSNSSTSNTSSQNLPTPQQQQQPFIAKPTPMKPIPTATPVAKPVAQQQQPPSAIKPALASDTTAVPRFVFPNVAPLPAGYYVSEEYKAEALALFERGLREYLAA